MSTAAVAGWRYAASELLEAYEMRVEDAASIDKCAHQIAQDPAAGVMVVPHTFAFAHRDAVIAAMTDCRVPAIYGIAEMVRSGGLISYGQDLVDQWRAGAGYVDKILRGADPGELPARFSRRHALAINTSEVAGLGFDHSSTHA